MRGEDYGHFVEGVGKVVLAFAELILPLLYEHLPDFREEGIFRQEYPVVETTGPCGLDKFGIGIDAQYILGKEAGKGGTDGFHAQGPHPVQDPVLKGNLVFMPALGQWRVDSAEIPQPHPGQMGGSYEVVVDLLVSESQLFQDAGGDGLIRNKGQGHIYPVQSHPIDFLFPTLPVPVAQCVAVRDHVEIIVVLERRDFLYRSGVRKR